MSGHALEIVSLYIGIGYLERILALANDWRLISDVEAWLSSLSGRARASSLGVWGRSFNVMRIHA